MPAFTSGRSLRVRGELSANLGIVVDTAIKHIDFSLISGARDTEQQQRLFHEHRSTLDGINKISKHQISDAEPLARAFDFIPAPFTSWDDRPIFTLYAGFFLGIGWEKGVELTWGGDWDGDFRWTDQNFHDLPHMEEKNV